MVRKILPLLVILSAAAVSYAGVYVVTGPPDDEQLEDAHWQVPAQSSLLDPGSSDPTDGAIEATVINPYRTADVASEVSGIIDRINFEEGERAKQGEVVVEISTRRFALLVEKARETVRGLELDSQRAEQEEKLRKELLSYDASTRRDLLKSQAEREILATKLQEARKDLELALLNLESAVVKAPFTGFIATRYKQPHESAERLEKIFSIVDTDKVYAVANVKGDLIRRLTKGSEAFFVDSQGRRVKGVVDKVGALMDPKSKTKKIYLLIDNSKGELEVGMTGSLQLPK